VNTPVPHIAHFDLDAFFVSVEILKNPALKGKPLIVGGDGQRGIVAACSYEARKFGIESAMPSLMAKRLCPHAVFIRGSYADYSQYSRLVTAIIADKAPLFEKASIDEFYVDLTGMEKILWRKPIHQRAARYHHPGNRPADLLRTQHQQRGKQDRHQRSKAERLPGNTTRQGNGFSVAAGRGKDTDGGPANKPSTKSHGHYHYRATGANRAGCAGKNLWKMGRKPVEKSKRYLLFAGRAVQRAKIHLARKYL
jgi:hypothetical protein